MGSIKLGRPGRGRAKAGKIRATILPELKAEAERIAANDQRWRSLSHLVETMFAYFLASYHVSNGRLDSNNFPDLGRGDPLTNQGKHKIGQARPYQAIRG